LRILFDKNVPVGVRQFLLRHEVRTVVEMGWPPQLENGELLKAAEEVGFDVLVLGSNIWPIVRNHGEAIASKVDGATPGSHGFIETPFPPKPRGGLRAP
jgi:hypothetical protein